MADERLDLTNGTEAQADQKAEQQIEKKQAESEKKAPEKSGEEIDPSKLTENDLDDKSPEELDKLIKQARNKSAQKDNAQKPPEAKPQVKAEDAAKKEADVKDKKSEAAELAELREYKKNMEYLRGRQGNEMGMLKKQNEELIARLERLEKDSPEAKAQREKNAAELREKILTDPEEVIKRVSREMIDNSQTTAETERERRQAEAIETRRKNGSALIELHPELTDKEKGPQIANTVIEILQERGYSAEEIETIRKDPFALPVQALDLFVTNAKDRLEVKKMKAQMDKFQNVPDSIDKAAKGQSIIAKSGQGAPTNPVLLTEAELEELSPEQIDARIREIRNKRKV